MSVKPITPDEALAQKASQIPAEVFMVVNHMITKNVSRAGRAILRQDDIIKELLTMIPVDRKTIFENNWLDFEDAYEKAGWKVKYDRPAYNETYEPTFEFTRKST